MLLLLFLSALCFGKGLSLSCKQKNHYALTFDDGPYDGVTNVLLDTLKASKVKATFFVCGYQLKTQKHADLLKRIDAEGHIIASHTWSHPHLNTLSDSQIVKEMNDTSDAIFSIIQKRPRFMRPPYGEADNRVKILLKAMGYVIIGWSIDTLDWQSGQTPTRMSLEVEKAIKPDGNGIILMHDLFKKSCAGLMKILFVLSEEKCQIVPMDVCLGNNYPYFVGEYKPYPVDNPYNPIYDGPFHTDGSPNVEEIEAMLESAAERKPRQLGLIGMILLTAGTLAFFL